MSIRGLGLDVSALQLDDRVMYSNGGVFETVVRVAKRTAKQVTLTNGARVNQNGNVIGSGSWGRSYVAPWSEEREAQANQARLRHRRIYQLRDVQWDKMSDETLAAVAAVLDAALAAVAAACDPVMKG